MKQHRLLTQQAECAQEHINRIRHEQEQGLYPKSFFMPLGLQFEITSKCGLYCKHCYNASGESHSKDEMTLTDWKQLVDCVIKEGGIFQCIISGGVNLYYWEMAFLKSWIHYMKMEQALF